MLTKFLINMFGGVTEAAFLHNRCSKDVANFTGNHLCWSHFLIKLQAWRSATLLKETQTQVFFSEFCEIFNNTRFTEHLRWLLVDLIFELQQEESDFSKDKQR